MINYIIVLSIAGNDGYAICQQQQPDGLLKYNDHDVRAHIPEEAACHARNLCVFLTCSNTPDWPIKCSICSIYPSLVMLFDLKVSG